MSSDASADLSSLLQQALYSEALQVLISHPGRVSEALLTSHQSWWSTLPLEILRQILQLNPQAVKARENGRSAIHSAVEGRASAEIVQMLLDADPEGINEQTRGGVEPILHLAINRHASAEILQMLLDADPEGIKIKNDTNSLPLHVAASSDASAEIIQLLLDAYPEGIKIKDNMATPLASAARDASTEVVRMLLDAYPEGVKDQLMGCNLPLHGAAARDWKEAPNLEVVRMLFDAYPKGAKHRGEDGQLPLHDALWNQAPAEVVRMLLDAYPEGAKETHEYCKILPILIAALFAPPEVVRMLLDAYPEGVKEKEEQSGNLPLHLALANRVNKAEVVRMLLDAYPEGVEVKNNEGHLPIFGVAEAQAHAAGGGAEVVRMLLDAYPEGVKDKDESDRLPLHDAAGRQAPVEVVRMLIDAYPEGVEETDQDDALPLHYAVEAKAPAEEDTAEDKAPAEVVRMLMDAYPEGVKVKNKNGNLPLHGAVANEAMPTEVVRMLLDAYPEGVKEKNKDDALPLHHAAKSKAPAEVVRMLMDAYPEGVEEKNKEDALPLHHAAKSKAPADVVRMLLDAYPEGVKEKDEDSFLPLHHGAKFRAPAEVVRMLLDAYPEGVKEKDKDDHLPLSLALEREASAEVVRMLLDAYPEGINERDKDDHLPLHLALERTVPAEVMRMLLDAYPEGVEEKNKDDALPLHHAAKFQATAEVMRMLLDAYPEGAKVRNKSGVLPLHVILACNEWACRYNKYASAKVVRMLVDAYPESVKEKDENDHLPLRLALKHKKPAGVVGVLVDAYPEDVTDKDGSDRLFLHYALEQRNSAEVVGVLVDAYPEGVKDTDEKGNLPLHCAAKYIVSNEQDVVRILMDAYPEGAKVKNNEDRLPIHYAAQNHMPPEVVRMLLDAYPEGAKMNGRGYLPLQCTNWEDAHPVKVRMLLDAYPESAKQKYDSGEYRLGETLPFFHAMVKMAHPETVRVLLDAYPDGAKEPLLGEENHDPEDGPFIGGTLPLHFCVEEQTQEEIQEEKQKYVQEYVRMLVDAYPDAVYCKDHGGRTPIDIAIGMGSKGKDILAILQASRYFLGMYELHAGVPAHRSRTCVVMFATEHPAKTPVALKFMRSREQFDRELHFRQNKALDSKHVMNVIRSHTASDEDDFEPFNASVKSFLASRIDDASSIQCCLVLPRADLGLHAALAHEHFAGTDILKVRQVATDVAVALQHVHEQGFIHGDVKPLNIMQCFNRYLLIDLDCACRIGERFGTKQPSTGFCPPEMARAILADDMLSYIASPTYDMWSLGALLFLLYTGQTLFHNEINDDIAQHDQLIALANQWDERRLEQAISVPVFADDARAEVLVDLIRWLLRADASERPQSVAEALKHSFFQEDVSKGVHGLHGSVSPGIFVSHFQEGGGGPTARQLKHDLSAEQRWLERHIWLDVDQKHINEDAMKAGVKSHRHFLVLLTKGYFERWFCKLELQTAIQHERKIVLVHETRPDLGGYASFGDYISEFKEQTQDGKLYADFPEAKQIFNVDSIPLYHEETLDPISMKRILARIDVAEPPSNAALLAAAMRVPQGARLAVLSSGSGMRQAETAIADMCRVCPTMTCTSSVDDESHVVVVFITRGVPDKFGDLVASLREQSRCVIALYQVDERKGYDGVRHEDLTSDARWQSMPTIPWVVYRDFREAALARILDTLATKAERSGVSLGAVPGAMAADSTRASVEDIVYDDVHSLDLVQQLEAERDALSKRVAQMEFALRNREIVLKRREQGAWLLQRLICGWSSGGSSVAPDSAQRVSPPS